MWDYKILRDKQRSSTVWLPLSGFFLPGLPQLLNGQKPLALTLAIGGAASVGVAIATIDPDQTQQKDATDFGNLSNRELLQSWGLKTYETFGELSVYHAFRAVAEQRRQRQGDFKFLTNHETLDEVMLAPFHFENLLRPTAFVPLLSLALLLGSSRDARGSLRASQGAFTLGISYDAGVGEESLFRGYLLMNLQEAWGSDFWANSVNAVAFGAAHISAQNPFPIFQTLFGFYNGWLVRRNDWTLSEAVFLHAWWDVIAIAYEISYNHAEKAPLWLPPLVLSF